MSENLDLVRSIHADWERGDYSATEWAHADIEYVRPDGPSPGQWTGLEGMAAGWRDFLNAWDNWRAEAMEYRELDRDRVLVFVEGSGHGRTSGLQIEAAGASVFQIDRGKVKRLVVYLDRALALADLGLKE
jgi:ketosteroid isomerase-like protein